GAQEAWGESACVDLGQGVGAGKPFGLRRRKLGVLAAAIDHANPCEVAQCDQPSFDAAVAAGAVGFRAARDLLFHPLEHRAGLRRALGGAWYGPKLIALRRRPPRR